MGKMDAFMFFRSYYEAASKILDEKDRLRYYDAICQYIFEDALQEDLNGTPGAMFTLTKPYLDKSKKRSEAGAKGGRSTKANDKQTVSKTEAKVKNPEAIKNKELRIKESLNTFCSEPDKSAPSGSGILLNLIDGSDYDVPEDKIKTWEQAYPAVNIRQELLRMASWLDANPTRKKTRRGITRFINGWLERVQNRGGAGRGLYLWSKTPGTGKTFLACCLSKSIMMKYDLQMRFITVPDYLAKIQDGFHREKGEEDPSRIYRECQLLVFDDIGSQKEGSWQDEQIFRIINDRMSNGLATIFTSNMPPEQLRLNNRTQDRITSKNLVLAMPEESIRAKKAKGSQDKMMSEILGR